LNDGGVSGEFWLSKSVMFTGSIQYEKWAFPVLDPMPRSNVVTSIGFSFQPELRKALTRNHKSESAE
jgi:hypothetical protein